MNLWTYIGKYGDTDFGGKTGTSNNHSDAWFMGVSPKLVVGAWVGGEYRCIHFRTGQLGQGSRTALPICGYFFQSVLGDPHFSKYRGKFQKPDESEIARNSYECVYYRHYVDTLRSDSLHHQDGNNAEGSEINTEEPKHSGNKDTEIYFDDL
jgi:penicillin-binding protein 1A